MAKGILYVMTTVVPGLIKIGKTGISNFESRMYNLEHNGYANVTGLCRRFAIEVDDYDEKEALLDTIFSKSNVVGTELFAIDVNLVVQLLSSFDGTVIYPKTEAKEKVFNEATALIVQRTDPNGKTATGKATKFKFSMVGIPIGAELEYIKDSKIKVKVADDEHISYKGEVWSMSGLARKLANLSSPTQGTQWFLYHGKKLTDLRNEQKDEA